MYTKKNAENNIPKKNIQKEAKIQLKMTQKR